MALSRGTTLLGTARASLGELLLALRALSLMPPPARAPALPLLDASASAWNVAQRGWRGSKPAPGTNGDDFPLAEGSLGASEGAGGAVALCVCV